ncbi:unnamed protein product [Ambrosiozyma monospora]|uniref:Unnamed protein product n=1 Tax=Ambrosiozyma monospora TaxID=43982 RepID=A0ACB5T9R2_AMBMO|nr:unnamed protein product [Ambrosiozyma monospora]
MNIRFQFVFLFDGNIITADNETIKGKGKPLPFIWWLGLDTLNQKVKALGEEEIKPEECLIFEDAIPGFISGKRAGGYVIWVPDSHALELLDKKQISELVGEENQHGIILKSLEEFDPSKFGL